MRTQFINILKRTREEKFAIGAFNFSTLGQLRAIFEAASELRSPIIVETSMGEAEFLGIDLVPKIVDVFKNRYKIKAFLNLDHGKNFPKIKKAIDEGYDMVQFDGSRLNYEENLTKTKEVVEYAHSHDVLVEGELGYLRGSSVPHLGFPQISEEDFTDPKTAEDFSQKTGIDFLAPAVGNIHGVFKNKEGNPDLDVERIKKIHQRTKVWLSLHGGSGTKEDDIKEAISAGISKINVNTDLRTAYTIELRETLNKNKEELTPYKYLPAPIKKVKAVVKDKIELFRSFAKLDF